jgi:hypothetical protein
VPAKYRNWTPEIVKRRIRVGVLLKRLKDHALGKVEMSPQQAASARFLIERIIPKAEADKNLNVNGSLTLFEAITQARTAPVVSESDPASLQ